MKIIKIRSNYISSPRIPKPHLFLARTRCHAFRAFNWLIETWRPTKSIEFNAELIDDWFSRDWPLWNFNFPSNFYHVQGKNLKRDEVKIDQRNRSRDAIKSFIIDEWFYIYIYIFFKSENALRDFIADGEKIKKNLQSCESQSNRWNEKIEIAVRF